MDAARRVDEVGLIAEVLIAGLEQKPVARDAEPRPATSAVDEAKIPVRL
jgi:hypothetical protein